MREPTCTPCVVRRIAFYNREILSRMLVTFPLRGEGGYDAARRDGRWTSSETCKRRKSSGARTYYSRVKTRKNENRCGIARNFSYKESALKNSHVLARGKKCEKSENFLSWSNVRERKEVIKIVSSQRYAPENTVIMKLYKKNEESMTRDISIH